jgi:hypothetical protein
MMILVSIIFLKPHNRRAGNDASTPVLWIRIRKNPKLFAGSGSVTRGMDPDPDSDPKLDLNLTKNHQKISKLIIMTLKYINLTFSLKNLL